MPNHIFTVEGATIKQRLIDLIDSDPELGAKSSRVKNIITQTPEEEIMPVIQGILDRDYSPTKAAGAISTYESQRFLDFRPVPWDEIHHRRGLDIFTSVRNLPIEERPKALDLMDQSGRTLGDTTENLRGTSFDVRTHTGANFKGTTIKDGLKVKVRDVENLNAGVKELSAHPFGTKETRAGIIVPDYDNAASWFEHASRSADAVGIDADRGIAIEQPRRQVVNKILQSGRGAPPISSFDIFEASPAEVRAANQYLSADAQAKARLSIYKSWKIPKNLDPALLPAGTTPELAQKLAGYFPSDMMKNLKFASGLAGAVPVLGALADAGSVHAAVTDSQKKQTKREALATALEGVSGVTGLASLAPPFTIPAGAISTATGLASTAVRNRVDKKAPLVIKKVKQANDKAFPLQSAINKAPAKALNEIKWGLKLLGIRK